MMRERAEPAPSNGFASPDPPRPGAEPAPSNPTPPDGASTYAPLWCKSNYSFLEGASHPEELVEACRSLGLPSLALTDRNGVYGIVRAHVRARELDVHLVVGSQVSLRDGSEILLLVQDREGYAHLCRLLTAGHLRGAKGNCRVSWEEVCRHSPGLIALWIGGTGSAGIGPAVSGNASPAGRDDTSAVVASGPDAGAATSNLPGPPAPAPFPEPLRAAFEGRLYVVLARHRRAEETLKEIRLRELAARFGLPTVAAVEVLYHTPGRRPLQDVLTCIREGVTLPAAGRLLRPNDQHALKGPEDMARLFADDPASLERTREVAARCTFSLGELRYRYPLERLPKGKTSFQYLEERTFEGAARRLGGKFETQVPQLKKELALIRELEYEGYFLTMHEIVEYCRRERILCQGRGSAANSAVCFALGITGVDPTQVNLLFERFISRERAEPPDIDLDIEHNRREEVIQHVYKKYGRTHAAMVANVVRYRHRSAIREVGKVLEIPATGLDRLARQVSHGHWDEDFIRQAGLDPENPALRHLAALVLEIQDFPRHLSIHPGGFLLGHHPVHELVPIENATMEGRTVIQWDKEDVEDAGLFKVDLLGLGALNLLHLGFDLLRRHRRMELSLATLPREDAATFDLICRSDTVGVFQIESRAQMAMLGRLKPRTYYDLVIEISIVRPGPITGGMVHPYLRRRNGEEEVTYPHESLVPVLEKTLGVPLFQEQVMQLAMVAADYTPGEADQLRRDMAAWRRSGRIERHRERLVSRMIKKGIAEEFAEHVFMQIRGFGEYGFPESHAASFAHIAYATAYLRCHYPAEFTCALLNAQPMGFYSPSSIVNDARIHGVEVRPVSLRRSRWDCTLEEIAREGGGGAAGAGSGRGAVGEDRGGGPAGAGGRKPRLPFAVRMGLRYVRGLGEGDGARLEAAMAQAPFRDIADVARRSGLSEDKLESLAEAGAFACFGPFGPDRPDRRGALWQVLGTETGGPPPLPLKSRGAQPRFQSLNSLETILWDHQAAGHSVQGHLLKPRRAELAARGLPTARELNGMPDGRSVRYVGLVICRQRPGTAQGVTFMTLEDETGFVNLVIWEKVFERNALLART
ncbi:MAG: error-prone DNA polymerase, partial [Gemmatimonadetes bacterium]|nr:error-prone DNA polymerase [Gemmatimonadota bacterium]